MQHFDKQDPIYLLSLKTGIEVKFIKQLQYETKSYPKRLKRDFTATLLSEELFNFDEIPEGKTVELPGVSFKLASEDEGFKIISKLRKETEAKNYRIFLDIYYGNDIDKIVDLSIISCNNDFDPLVYMYTNGINYGITNQKLIDELRILDKSLGLKILGAGEDWCEFEITKEPESWFVIIAKIFELCPDIAEKYDYSLEDFKTSLIKTRRLYLWFD